MMLAEHPRPLITLSSDFGYSSRGIGVMEVVARNVCPEADVVHLAHEIPSFSILEGAREMEAVAALPVGYHVCVVDPGVGTKREVVAIKTKRGDVLVGPDNGVLIPAARWLGGIEKAVYVTNVAYMLQPVSETFHGRDVMVPAAASLAKGAPLEDLGEEIAADSLTKAPYDEATWERGGTVNAKVIRFNKFGTAFLNIRVEAWDEQVQGVKEVTVVIDGDEERMPLAKTFGDVKKGESLFFADDYGRMALAVNMGSFEREFKLKAGQNVQVIPAPDAPFHLHMPGKE